ncbi:MULTISPECIES: DUF4184 family protein [unclassified Kitasatospora]|uniref:DUF4184 family protein n=1 Tax=unclassified Kitasatospora TaxID=2633591 RepID=UPI000709D2A1|nr:MULTISPECIES: DUF4184 family protein [unclassified Kitasatospora]KQV16548.1 hypothetical protein ASC99_27570 [Kitasatospora sp. Root107]KRB71577.1 hypothetical protein ASE03_23695 [Kitasatospora sp. Root187]
MPFTLSHPAAVLPLLEGTRARGPLVAAGLVAGSMAPDVPYFADSLLRGCYDFGAVTHRWWAVPTVDVLIAGGLTWWWYGLVRPGRHELGRYGWFAVSAAIGAATHVCWDSFTHEGRAGVRAFPVLNTESAGIPLYTVLQYGSSAVGLALLTRHRPPAPALPRTAVAGLALATAAGVLHRLARRERGLISEFCFGAGAGLAAGLTVYALGARHPAAFRRGSGG